MTRKSKVPEPDFSKQCQELHDHLLSKLDHNWQLDTYERQVQGPAQEVRSREVQARD